jgi:hypothetical protein
VRCPIRPLFLLLTASLVSGCLGQAVLLDQRPFDDPDVPPVETTEPTALPQSRFTGTWLIEETMPHATYFASMWEFADDGRLTLVQDFSVGGPGYPTVSWAGNLDNACSFGDRWSSPDDQTLQVTGLRTFGSGQIEIVFDADQAGNAMSVTPTSMSVDGDTDMWSEPAWGWHFVKCEGDFSNCAPLTF